MQEDGSPEQTGKCLKSSVGSERRPVKPEVVGFDSLLRRNKK